MTDKLTKPQLMGILNVTPDSFSDGGHYHCVELALAHAQQMLAQGADIIDVGGESTRPYADAITPAEQIARVVPVITALRQHSAVPISIDTTSAQVAQAALQAGATMINDVSGALADTAMLKLAATAGVEIVLMHSQGTPKTMQVNPYYDDVVAEVRCALQQHLAAALSAGIALEKIIIDVGIGFGKRKQDNLCLLAHLQTFVDLGVRVLLGTSRKRFMGTLCQVSKPHELVTATAVTTALGVMAGVQLFRVHDIEANRQAIDVAWAIKCSQHPVDIS